MEINQLELGKAIKKHRLAKHMTQTELAEKIGIQTKSISYIERGINYPSTDNLFKIILELEISMDEFIYGETKFDSLITVNEINHMILSISPKYLPAFYSIIKATAEEMSKLK